MPKPECCIRNPGIFLEASVTDRASPVLAEISNLKSEAVSLTGVKRPAVPARPPRTPRPVYREQFGLIVICPNEAAQRRLYGRLVRMGLAPKVVTT
jgi:hypothetical protein